MKIAFVSAAKSSHTVKWVNALAQKGHEVRLYSLPNHSNRLKNIDSNVKIIYLKQAGFKGYFLNSRQLKKEIEEFKPDLINAHYASGYGNLTRMAHIKAPYLLSIWGSDVYVFPYKSFLHKALIICNVKAATTIASTSTVMAQQLDKVYDCKKKFFITPFGVDVNHFQPSHEKKEHDQFVVGIVKMIEEIYGIEYLIQGFSTFVTRLQSEHNPLFNHTQLCIYGKGNDEQRLKQIAAQCENSDKIKFMGFLPNEQVADITKRFSAVCLPSISESFGVSAVEAMACSVPVIASDADGFIETVVDGVTGYLVPKKNAQAIADKLYELATHPELCESMGKAGREHVLKLYDFEKNVETMEQAYKETIELYKSK